MSNFQQYSTTISGYTIKWCPKCQNYSHGNYCNICGTKLEEKAPTERECPCCGGSGKVPYYPHYPLQPMPMYAYMTFDGEKLTSGANPYNISE